MKICCIFNIAPLYRKSIYALMQSELDVQFYFGNYTSDGIALLPVEPRQTLKNRYCGTKLVWQRRAIRRAFSRRYDAYILTGNAGILSNWIIAIIARIMRRKVYLWSHGLYGNETPSVLRKNLLYIRLAGNLLLYGERAKALLAKHGITSTWVIYNSLDYQKHLETRYKIGGRVDDGFLRNYFGNDLPTICYLGRLTRDKKLEMLLDLMPQLECNLVIVGGGEAQESLERQAQRLAIIDNVWFYGESYDEIFIGTLLSSCIATVSPSSIGLTAIHSLTFGTPVITHNDMNSQMPEAEIIQDGVTGFLYQYGDSKSLLNAINKALQTPKESEKCFQIVAEKYNPEVQINILKQIFGTDIEHTNGSNQ